MAVACAPASTCSNRRRWFSKGSRGSTTRAKFVGLLEADYDFILALAQKPARDISAASHQSYDMLPARIQAEIVAKLVGIKRLAPPQAPGPARFAAHYAGIEHANDGIVYHRFFIRSHMDSPAGAFVFNTEALISDDGAVKLRT